MKLIFSSVFKIFFLSLVLKNVASLCPSVIFFIFLVMGFVELPGSMGLQFSSNFQGFQPLYLHTIFSLPSLLWSYQLHMHLAVWSVLTAQGRTILSFFLFFFWVSFLYVFHFTHTPLLVATSLKLTSYTSILWGNIFDQNCHSPFNLLLLQRRKLNS